MEKLFKLKEHHTDVKTEVIAGITTFTTMAYILAVNPNMLGDAGMDTGAVFTATALASFVACLMMGLTANLPFALSAGMGLNAYFAYTICGQMGYSWHVALAAVFVEGLLFILLSLTNVREAVFNAIPKTLKFAVSVGIGLFIAFSGLQNAHIVTDSTTLVSMFSFKASMEAGTFRSEGITVLLASAGVLITAILLIKKVRGNILIGIGATWILGIICQLTGLYVPDPDAGFYSLLPSGIFSMPASMAPTFLKMSFSGIGIMDFITIMLDFSLSICLTPSERLLAAPRKQICLTRRENSPRCAASCSPTRWERRSEQSSAPQQLPHSSNLQRVSLTAGAPGLPQSSQAFSFCCHFSCRPYFSLYHHLPQLQLSSLSDS